MKPIALTFLVQSLPDANAGETWIRRVTSLLQPGGKADLTWIGWFVSHIFHPLILFAVLAGIAATIAGLVAEASRDKPSSPNVRAVAAVILPLVAGIWTLKYWGKLLEELIRPDGWKIAVTLGIGFFFSLVFGRGSRHQEWRTISGIFLATVGFSILFFGYAAAADQEVFRLYYALAIGLLIRLTVFGMPRASYRYSASKEVFEIKPGPADQYELYWNGVLRETFDTAESAAHDFKDGDKLVHVPEISDWEVVYRWEIHFPGSQSRKKVAG